SVLLSPPHGASSVLRDGANRLFTFGYYERAATLGKDALTETTDVPASIFPGQVLRESREMPEDASERPRRGFRAPHVRMGAPGPLQILAGDHVLEIALGD